MNLLERVTHRRSVVDHDGRSGARIERGVLDDGSPVYVKTTEVANDLGHLLTGDARRELRLWRAGVFDALPDGVGTAVVGIDDQGDRLIVVTRDLGTSVLTWDRTLTLEELCTVFGAITAVHRRFAGAVPGGLCPLATRLGVFAPSRLDSMAGANPELAAAIGRGHEVFAELVLTEVVEAVHACYADPGPLAAAMTGSAAATLLHGDFFLPNIALEVHQVTPLDWGLATAGPAPLDLITFCVGAMSHVDVDRPMLLAEARAACEDLVDNATFALAEFWALMELGWNKALDAIDHPDPAKRATERADLDFWVTRARRVLDAGLLPTAATIQPTR